MPTEWWLRPVSSAWRVGEHSAVVWKRLYLSPLSASRSAVGVDAGPAEGARGAEAAVVDEDDEHVRRAVRRAQRLDRREGGVGILGVVGDQAIVGPVGDRQDVALHVARLPARGVIRHHLAGVNQSCSAAKYSSAARVFAACSPERLTPTSSRWSRACVVASNQSAGAHFVDSSMMRDPSG